MICGVNIYRTDEDGEVSIVVKNSGKIILKQILWFGKKYKKIL